MCVDTVFLPVEPFSVDHYDQETGEVTHTEVVTQQEVPCGKCLECKATKVAEWAFRLEQEVKYNPGRTARFVTLTYNEFALNDTCKTENGYYTLNYKDFRDYMKRLRNLEEEKVKYFVVGEYGTKSYRPHFHAVVFGAKDENIAKAWSYFILPTKDNPEGTHVSKGFVHLGNVNNASCQYIMNYVQKPMYDTIKKKHPDFDGVKEMRRMSNGIGSDLLKDKRMVKHYSDPKNQKCVLESGRKLRLPRYYRDRMYSDEDHKYSRKLMYLESRERLCKELEIQGLELTAIEKRKKANGKKHNEKVKISRIQRNLKQDKPCWRQSTLEKGVSLQKVY